MIAFRDWLEYIRPEFDPEKANRIYQALLAINYDS